MAYVNKGVLPSALYRTRSCIKISSKADPHLWPPSCLVITFPYFLCMCENKKLKCYITSCSFCLCNPACSLQSLDHIGLRKWALTILGAGAYLTHPCPALCNRPSPCKLANLLNHACPCIKNSVTPLFGAQSLECWLFWALRRNKPEFSNSPSVVLGFPSTGFCNSWSNIV